MDDSMLDGFMLEEEVCWHVLNCNMPLPQQIDLLWLIFSKERHRFFTNGQLVRTSFVSCYREMIACDMDYRVAGKFLQYFPSDIFELVAKQEKKEKQFEQQQKEPQPTESQAAQVACSSALAKYYGDDMTTDSRVKSTRRLSITMTRDYSHFTTQQLQNTLNDNQDNYLDDHPIYCWHVMKCTMALREKCDLLFIILSDDRQRDSFGKWMTNCTMVAILRSMAFSDLDMQIKNELLNFFPYNTHEMDRAELNYILKRFSPASTKRSSVISLSGFISTPTEQTSRSHSSNTPHTNKKPSKIREWLDKKLF